MNAAEGLLTRLRGVYGIVDDGPGFELSPVAWARALTQGGASVIQLRFKRTPMGEALAQARTIRRENPGVLLLVNDRVDLALLCDADGVHLGEHDLPIADARRLLGPERVIGATIRNAGEGAARLSEGANYLGAGPVFASATKSIEVPLLGVEGLRRICETLGEAPVVAISGIDEHNIASVVAAGARAAAVIGAVGKAADPASAARRLSAAFEGSP